MSPYIYIYVYYIYMYSLNDANDIGERRGKTDTCPEVIYLFYARIYLYTIVL